jgi:hypothetical protein
VDSVYLKELARATHRGLEGRVLKGLSAGGRCFGYDTDPVESGGVRWIINNAEAVIIRQIFEWSAAGYSLKRIAGILNDQKTNPPRKRADRPCANWCLSAIREMLRRDLYVGRRVWNKTRFVKTICIAQMYRQSPICCKTLRSPKVPTCLRPANDQQSLVKSSSGRARLSATKTCPSLPRIGRAWLNC